jgi:hypothetical protein
MPESPPELIPSRVKSLSSYFAIAKKVQEKAVLKEQLLTVAKQRQTDEMVKMADLLNTLYTGKGRTSLPIGDIIDNVQKTDYFRGLDRGRIVKILEELVESSDGYFTKVDVRGLSYIQIERSATRSFQMARGSILRHIFERGKENASGFRVDRGQAIAND